MEKRNWRYPVGVGAAASALLALLVFVGVRLDAPADAADVAPALPQSAPPRAALQRAAQQRADDWLEASNRNTALLLDVVARYAPESAASLGVEGHDEDVFDLAPRVRERRERDLAAAIATLESRRDTTSDARVRQDLEILIESARDRLQSSQLQGRLLLPFFDLGQALFGGFRALLDDRVAAERRPAALVRLRRYTGVENGYTPITELARARFEERMGEAALLGPWRNEVQQALDNQSRYLDGIEALLVAHGLDGGQADLDRLRGQFERHAEWMRDTVLPRARPDHRLPLELYADALKGYGVRMAPERLLEEALASFVEARDEIDVVARRVALERGLPDADYRAVLRALKQERIPDDEILPRYRSRLAAIEDIVRRERIVTLPEREAVIRLATEAESAATPAPYLDTPRLVGNTGEPAAFVLPMSNPNAKSGAAMDDFTYDAISWTLTAHEARPGHELQFATMLERGVSTARSVFAFNSANVEGWALYAEAQVKQYLPPEGQLGALQMRMMRAARAFLDPMLNLGLTTPDAAKRFLMEEVVLSEPMAQQEVDRYTFVAPGQATSYFYGYRALNALRARTELELADDFDALAYHDFVLGQGLLPFDLLERAVMNDFVAARRGGA